MKLISEKSFGETFEVEVGKDLLIQAIETESNIITKDGQKLEFWGKRDSRGVALFKMEAGGDFGGHYSFSVVYNEENFRYDERPLNTVVELEDFNYEQAAEENLQDLRDLGNG